jgi:hypothetical protein
MNVPKSVAQCLAGDAVSLIPHNGIQLPWATLDVNLDGGVFNGCCSISQLLTESNNSVDQIVVSNVDDRSPCTAWRPSVIASAARSSALSSRCLASFGFVGRTFAPFRE